MADAAFDAAAEAEMSVSSATRSFSSLAEIIAALASRLSRASSRSSGVMGNGYGTPAGRLRRRPAVRRPPRPGMSFWLVGLSQARFPRFQARDWLT